MRRWNLVWLSLCGAGIGFAQTPPPGSPPPPANQPPRPTVVNNTPRANVPPTPAKSMSRGQRVRYIFKQLELTPDQRQQAEALLDSITGGAGVEGLSIEKVREVWGAIQQATQAGDQAAVDRYTEQLRQMGKQNAGSIEDDQEFLTSLRSILTDEQKKTLDRVVGWLTRNPSGLMRPVDLFDICRELKLTEGQLKQMSQVEADCRRKANETQANDDKAREALSATVTSAISSVLTPEQRTQFEARIKRMTTADIAPEPVSAP